MARESGSVSSRAVPLLTAVAIGVLLGSWAVARDNSCFGSNVLMPAVPAVSCVAAAALAIVFRERPANRGFLLIGAGVLVGLEVLAALLAQALAPADQFALGLFATLADGVATAVLLYLTAAALVICPLRTAAVAVAGGYVVLGLYDGAFMGVGPAVRVVQWLLGQGVAVVLVGCLLKIQGKLPALGQRGDGASSPLFRHKGDRELPPAGWWRQTALLVVFSAVLLLIQGAYSHITGIGGAGQTALFDMTVEIYVIGVRIAVLVFFVVAMRPLRVLPVAAFAALLWTGGLVLVTLLWSGDFRFAGVVALNSGRYVMHPVLLVFAVQAAMRFPMRKEAIIFAMLAAMNSCYITRLFGLFMGPDAAYMSQADMGCFSVVAEAIILVALVGLAALLGFLREETAPPRAPESMEDAVFEGPHSKEGTAPAALASGWNAVAPDEWDDELLQATVDNYRRFKRLCETYQLPAREKEVLLEAMHGYSIDHIAERLSLSRQTIKTYLSRAYGHLGVSSKQEALRLLDEVSDGTRS